MTYFEEMAKCYADIKSYLLCNATKKKRITRCKELMEEHPELKEYYIINEDEYFVSERISCTVKEHLKDEIHALLKPVAALPTYDIDCLKIDDNEHYEGIYFVGDIKYDPTYGKLHLVKVGGSTDVAKRMKTYTTHNPMFYHNYTSIPCSNFRVHEKEVQGFLERVAIGLPPTSCEWYIVDEETYYKLCDLFKNKIIFTSIANGEWLF
jgi:hypothetical protein